MFNSSLSRQNQNISGSQHRQQVSAALNQARSAFGAQHTEQDGVKFKEACERLEQFLDLSIPMEETEQATLVQILQIACAMHENAINSLALTRAQRTAHRRASYDLTVVCNKGSYISSMPSELRWELVDLAHRAEKAFAEDFSRCFSMNNWKEEDTFGPAAPSPVPAPSYLPSPRPSMHNINDHRQARKAVQPNNFHGSAPPAHTPSYSPAPGAFSYNANYTTQAPLPAQSNVFYGSANGAGLNTTVPSPALIHANLDDYYHVPASHYQRYGYGPAS